MIRKEEDGKVRVTKTEKLTQHAAGALTGYLSRGDLKERGDELERMRSSTAAVSLLDCDRRDRDDQRKAGSGEESLGLGEGV